MQMTLPASVHEPETGVLFLLGRPLPVAQVLFEGPPVGAVFDLALLLRRQFLAKALPWSGSGVTGHDASERLDLCDDIRESEMLDLRLHLSRRFVAHRGLGKIRLSAEPPDIQTDRRPMVFVKNGSR